MTGRCDVGHSGQQRQHGQQPGRAKSLTFSVTTHRLLRAAPGQYVIIRLGRESNFDIQHGNRVTSTGKTLAPVRSGR